MDIRFKNKTTKEQEVILDFGRRCKKCKGLLIPGKEHNCSRIKNG